MAQIHRFHDKVAIYLGNGETVYLTADEALELGSELTRYGNDVRNKTYLDSQIGTYNLDLEAETNG
jgi:hypothetical protein